MLTSFSTALAVSGFLVGSCTSVCVCACESEFFWSNVSLSYVEVLYCVGCVLGSRHFAAGAPISIPLLEEGGAQSLWTEITTQKSAIFFDDNRVCGAMGLPFTGNQKDVQIPDLAFPIKWLIVALFSH